MKSLKKKCPFCKPIEITMIRPRSNMIKWGLKKEMMSLSKFPEPGFTEPIEIQTLGEIETGDESLFNFQDSKNRKIKYYDYMCPKCNLVLLYGEEEK